MSNVKRMGLLGMPPRLKWQKMYFALANTKAQKHSDNATRLGVIFHLMPRNTVNIKMLFIPKKKTQRGSNRVAPLVVLISSTGQL